MHSFSPFDRVFSKKRALRSVLALAAVMGISSVASAAAISLNASDSAGTSSFNSGLNWAGGAAPSAGNTYSVNVAQRRLRTPGDANSYTFAGDSLTIANGYNPALAESGSSDDLFGLTYKGTGATGVITVNNLILAGGSINQLSGTGDVFTIAGNLSITGTSIIRAKQGGILINAAVSGSSNLHIGSTDGGGASRSVTFAGTNTFAGNIITTQASSVFTLAPTGNIKFVIGAAGVNNRISGPGTATLNGRFDLDLTGASTTIGDSWTLVDAGTVVETYGTTFSIQGFTESNNVWTGQVSGHYYQFTEATGVLAVIDTPPAFPPPNITSGPRTNTVVVGSNVTLSVTATGVGSLTYQWFKDSAPLSGQTANTLTLNTVQTTDSGTYSVTVTDHAAEGAGQAATTSSASATLTVITAADATVAYYRFEEGSDTAGLSNATDSSAGANTLSASGSLTYSATVPYGKVPRTLANNTLAAAFPTTGNNGLVAATNGPLANTAFTSFTIEAFVRHSALGGFQTYVGRDDSANPGEGTGAQSLLYLQKNSGNVFRVELIDKSNVNLQVNSTVAAAVDTWYHIAAVGDAGAGTLKLYLNGTEIGSVNGFTGLFAPTSGADAPWTLGRGDYAAADVDFFRGFLDEVRISRVALAPTQFLNSNGTGFFANPTITQAPTSQTVRVGANASFTVAATAASGGTLTYQWYKNNVLLSGQTSATLSLTSVTTAADDTYSVVVTDPAGADIGVTLSSTATAVLRVVDVPAASRAISLNFVGASSGGNFSTVLGTVPAGDSVGFVPVVNWNNSATVTGVFTQTTPLALIENTGTSAPTTATWESANTWAARTTTGDPTPGAATNPKTGDFRLLHGYIETRAATGANVILTNIPYASYDVYVYLAGGTNGTIGKTSINRESSSTYYYRVAQHDAYTSATAPTTMIGYSTDATAAASAPAATFVRFAGVTGADLTITTSDNTLNANAGGITAISIVDRTPAGTPYPPTATLSSASQLKAGGSSASFTVTASSNNSGGVLSYQWQKDGVNIGGQTSATLSLSGLTGSSTGTYSVVVTDNSSLGAASTTKSASLVVVDATRPLLINGDLNGAATPTFVGNGILRTTGSSNTDLGVGTTVWNGILGASGTATRSLTKESTGLSIPGVSFTYAGAQGVEDNTAAGFINGTAMVALSRDYLYTDNQTTPLTGSISGLDAFVGQEVTLVVYAYGKLSTAFNEALTSDTATVTLATANNHLGSAPYATSTGSFEGRDITFNNLISTSGATAAYATFTGVVAPGGTVNWSIGPDSDAGRIPLVGFQLLISGTSLAPAVPTGLAAVGGNNQVSLTWNAVSGADTYTIGRSTTSGGPYTTISAGLVTGTSYTDSTAVNGTTYYYVVASAKTSPAVQSAYSAQVSATPANSATGLQTWRQTHFGTTANSGNAANSADPDGDGLVNLLEYALGTNPTVAAASPVTVGQSGGTLTLTFSPVVDTNLSYAIEASSDLAGAWSTVHTYGSFASTAPVTYTDSVVLSSVNSKRFLRLKVTSTE